MKTIQHIIDMLQEEDYLEYCTRYGEPGYNNPKKGILFFNWNNVDRRIPDLLERAGYAIEWQDEWYIDHDNQKAWRTSPDCHQWVCQIKYCDGYVLTPDDDLEEWFDECKSTDHNQPHSALSDWITPEDLQEHGWEKWNGTYESGFYPGQNDDPTKIYQEIDEHVENLEAVVFRISSTGQFDIDFEAYYKTGGEVES